MDNETKDKITDKINQLRFILSDLECEQIMDILISGVVYYGNQFDLEISDIRKELNEYHKSLMYQKLIKW